MTLPRRAGPVPLPVNVGSQIRSHGLLPNECRKGEAAASALGSIRWETVREAASNIHRILRGANPGELPVQTPAKYRLIINLKTARALALPISDSFLLRVDEVIE